MELDDSKPVQPARKGALLRTGGGVQMMVTGRREQNQAVRETSTARRKSLIQKSKVKSIMGWAF